MIWNVGSHGELPGLLTQLPMWPFMDWSITPCIFSKRNKSTRQLILKQIDAIQNTLIFAGQEAQEERKATPHLSLPVLKTKRIP